MCKCTHQPCAHLCTPTTCVFVLVVGVHIYTSANHVRNYAICTTAQIDPRFLHFCHTNVQFGRCIFQSMKSDRVPKRFFCAKIIAYRFRANYGRSVGPKQGCISQLLQVACSHQYQYAQQRVCETHLFDRQKHGSAALDVSHSWLR